MHDTAVGTANFTGCVPASTGEGSGSPATEGALTRRARQADVRCSCGIISAAICL